MLRKSTISPLVVLWCGAFILCVALGVRHSFGLFLQPMSLDNEWGRGVFAFSIALQNLVWGFAQPFVGRLADRKGAGVVMMGGAVLYACGLALMSQASTPLMLVFGAGLLIGVGLSGTTFPVVFGAISKVMPPEKRSMAMGIAMALGSLGQFSFLPGGLFLINSLGWSHTLIAFGLLSLCILPLAWPLVRARQQGLVDASVQAAAPAMGMWASLRMALSHKPFLALGLGYFVCGFQVIFIMVHLPAYVVDQGVSAAVGSMALAMIGLFNILGSYAFGYWGGRMRKPALLSAIYGARAVFLLLFVLLPVTPFTVLAFASAMGFIWLSTVPLTTGTVGSMFGVQNLGMLSGLVFLFHQVGSFMGGWLGGLLFDATGSYTLVWWICIALSVLATLINWPIQERDALPAQPGLQVS